MCNDFHEIAQEEMLLVQGGRDEHPPATWAAPHGDRRPAGTGFPLGPDGVVLTFDDDYPEEWY